MAVEGRCRGEGSGQDTASSSDAVTSCLPLCLQKFPVSPSLLSLSLCAPLSHPPLWSLGSREAPPPGGPRNYGKAPGVCRGRGPHPQRGRHCLLSVSPAADEPARDGWGRVSVNKPILCPPNTAPSCSPPPRAAAEAPALVRGSGLPHCPTPHGPIPSS